MMDGWMDSYYGRLIGTRMYAICQKIAISDDPERTVTLFSRSHHSLTLNISQTATETAVTHSSVVKATMQVNLEAQNLTPDHTQTPYAGIIKNWQR